MLEAMQHEDAAGIFNLSNELANLSRNMRLLVTWFFEQRASNLGKMVGRSDIKVSQCRVTCNLSFTQKDD